MPVSSRLLSRTSRNGSIKPESGTVTMPVHPDGHNHDSGETTTVTSPRTGNVTGTRAKLAHSQHA